MIDPSQVTIIIPHLGVNQESKYALEQCLDSLLETCECRILVALNGEHAAANLLEWPLEFVYNERVSTILIPAQGQCKAVNAAVATTNTPWIFVTNDDMVYPPGWFEKLTKFSNPDIHCISPKLVEPRPGAPTFIVEFCGGAGGDFDKQKFLNFVKNYKDPKFDISRGFNLPFLITRELWNTVGGYDINYDPWGSNSDSDLEYKIKLAGVQSYQDSHVLVYHFSQTSGTFEPKNRPSWEKNWQYFIDKWGFPRTDDGIWEASFTIPDEGRIFRPEWEGKYGKS